MKRLARPRHRPSHRYGHRSKRPVHGLMMCLICISSILPVVLSAEDQGPYGLDPDAYILRYKNVFAPVISRLGMVSTQNELATRVGIDILQAGGNAIDAAVAVGFALAVVLPRAGNLGGGGFMLIHAAETLHQPAATVALDYRETAAGTATAQDFLTVTGERDRKSRYKWPAVGVPGTVAGMYAAWKEYGKLSWQEVVRPAIKLASQGFKVSYDLAEILAIKKTWLQRNEATRRALYKQDESAYQPGEVMKRPHLAWSLRQIAKHGADSFYRGKIAKRIVADMQKHGGHITSTDLASYEAIFRKPIQGQYRGYTIAAMPPPSSGGIAIIEILNILENFAVAEWGYSADYVHVLAESMKLAFLDRSMHLADPAFFDVPIQRLIDKAYAKQLARRINLKSTIKLKKHTSQDAPESPSTTHYSIVDAAGNAVSNTYTLSSSFGAGLTVAGTGILLNNQIATFSVRAGIAGATGFLASKANRLEPGKRPVSSQSPTIILSGGKPFLVLGSPGGSRIINAVVQVISNVIDHGMNVAEATNQRRIHHQWMPDKLEVEPGFNLDTVKLLRSFGQNVITTFTMGSTQSILITPQYIFGASDPRRPNATTRGID